MPQVANWTHSDLLLGIAPVFRLDLKTSEAHLIGTGFWITHAGHLVTAWHVVSENIDAGGKDLGPIFAIQTFFDRSTAVRNFSRTDKHPKFDLALSETVTAPPQVDRPTSPLTLTLDEVLVDDPVHSLSVLADEQTFDSEKLPGETVAQFHGRLVSDGFDDMATVKFAVRLSLGYVTEVFNAMRDKVLLPFPCIQTDVPIYGGNSGGPLFDDKGRVCAVHCTSYEGTDVAFHVPIRGVLQLRVSAESLNISADKRTDIQVAAMAWMRLVSVEPPLLNLDKPLLSIFRWLSYVFRQFVRGRLPSFNIHIFSIVDTAAEQVD